MPVCTLKQFNFSLAWCESTHVNLLRFVFFSFGIFLSCSSPSKWMICIKDFALLSESMNNKKDNSFYLINEKYNTPLTEMKDEKHGCIQSIHFRHLKRYWYSEYPWWRETHSTPRFAGKKKFLCLFWRTVWCDSQYSYCYWLWNKV